MGTSGYGLFMQYVAEESWEKAAEIADRLFDDEAMPPRPLDTGKPATDDEHQRDMNHHP